LTKTKYSLKNCADKEKSALVEKLSELSQLSWNDLYKAPRHGLGCEIIKQNSMNVPIPEMLKDDRKLLAFRFDAKKPMVGFREGNIFFIIWVDRDFTLYDHQ
jgi:hypothetical protein